MRSIGSFSYWIKPSPKTPLVLSPDFAKTRIQSPMGLRYCSSKKRSGFGAARKSKLDVSTEITQTGTPKRAHRGGFGSKQKQNNFGTLPEEKYVERAVRQHERPFYKEIFIGAHFVKIDGDRRSNVLYDEENHIYYGFGTYN
ncbi:MAG: hypothetical protein GY822_23500 [Deltaproteobacteria bacterium]|nr:hypothetical protein [Deltaproteobacteria bacterium]